MSKPLSTSDINQLNTALSILMGDPESVITYQMYDDLGYDSYKFGIYGTPSKQEVREKCKDIILCAFIGLNNAFEKVKEPWLTPTPTNGREMF